MAKKKKMDNDKSRSSNNNNSSSSTTTTSSKKATSSSSKPFRIFIGNLEAGVTEAQLRDKFADYRHILRVEIQRNHQSAGSAGGIASVVAFIEFDNAEVLVRAIDEMQGKRLGNKDMILCED